MSASQGRDSGTWASDQLNADKPRQQTKQSRQAAFWRTWPLLWVIATWAAIAFVLFITVGLLIWWFFINDPQTPGADLFVGENGADPLKFLQIILAIVGGVGAVGYLVIKYRERSDAESSKADQRLLEAVTQLGSDSPQVRIAGVYALADIADTFQGSYKQRVVDILCGYLRTDRISESRESSISGIDLRVDAAVESTIISVFQKHVSKEAEPALSWSYCDFDLHGARFVEPVDLNRSIFFGNLDFMRSIFLREALFYGSTFEGRGVNFHNSVFEQGVRCEKCAFRGVSWFLGTQFDGLADFKSVKFEDFANFSQAQFRGSSTFRGASFGGEVKFRKASFGERVDFGGVKFGGDADFMEAKIGNNAILDGVSFAKEALFVGSSFGAGSSLNQMSFEQAADFSETSFGDGTTFVRTLYAEGSVLTQVQEEWLQREGVEGPLEDQLKGDAAQEPSNESGADNAEENDNAGSVADDTLGESGAADEKSTDNN